MLWLVVSLQTIKVRNLTEVKNFVWQRVRKFFKFENPTPVQTPATLDPTEIYPWFYLRNYHADSCTAKIENWLRIRTRFFTNFWHRHWFGKKNEESRRSTLRHSGPWQKWYRIQSAGVDSGTILRFSFKPGSGPWVKNLWETGSGVTFQFWQ